MTPTPSNMFTSYTVIYREKCATCATSAHSSTCQIRKTMICMAGHRLRRFASYPVPDLAYRTLTFRCRSPSPPRKLEHRTCARTMIRSQSTMVCRPEAIGPKPWPRAEARWAIVRDVAPRKHRRMASWISASVCASMAALTL